MVSGQGLAGPVSNSDREPTDSTSLIPQPTKYSYSARSAGLMTTAMDTIERRNGNSSATDIDDPGDHAVGNTSAPIAHERWTRTPRPRGRQAKDPLEQSIRFQCQGMEDFGTTLREYLENPTGDPAHTLLEFTFPISAAFMVLGGDSKSGMAGEKGKTHLYGALNKTAVSVIDALAPTMDPREQMRKQKSIAKALVDTIQRADGFRYSFHNNWVSKEDEASRFSFYCNDSTLNKGRAANEGAGTVGKKMRKPAYDCRGLLAVKFSATKQRLEVQYKHVPLHQTYEERAPPPRKDSKRRRLMEIFEPEKLPPSKERKRKAPAGPKDLPPRKRRATEPLPATTGHNSRSTTAREDSLQPLIDFLGSADHAGSDPPTASGTTEAAPRELAHDPPTFPAEKVDQLHKGVAGKPSKGDRSQPPSVPGMMSGFMSGDSITWGIKEKPQSRRSKKNSRAGERVQGIVAPAADASDIRSRTGGGVDPMSELEALKAKLLEAEQRIERLEAEKAHQPPLQAWPPPPTAYLHPSYPPPPYHYPPAPLQHVPLRHHSPTQQQGPATFIQYSTPADEQMKVGQKNQGLRFNGHGQLTQETFAARTSPGQGRRAAKLVQSHNAMRSTSEPRPPDGTTEGGQRQEQAQSRA